MGISMIACLDVNNGIGKEDGSLLFDLPKDMKHFVKLTEGKICVMGRKTWESLPKKPLPKRKNVILTNDRNYDTKGKATLVHSVEEVLKLSKTNEVMIIGGGEIYELFLPHASKLHLTHVHTIDIEARTFFPDYTFNDWKLIGKPVVNKQDRKHKYSFAFADYERRIEE